MVAKNPIKKRKLNRKPNRQLDCQGVKWESGKVGKITFSREPPMMPLGDLGKW